ncbi:MAG: SDR family NAD(P)-dependent oxidoreductase [Steroidobacteraceae bacterium]
MSGGMLIIAGAGPGIGLAAARRFGAEGLTVALIGRREEALTGYQRELEDAAIKAIFRVADCADATQFDAALQEILSAAGPADALLYNAANIKWKNLLDDTAAALTADFAVNVAGALTAVRAVLPAMRTRNRGTLLLTGSSFSENPVASFGSLSISKAGLRSLGHSVAQSLRDTAIKVHYLSISGRVSAEDPLRSPQLIAERCWQLHAGTKEPATIDIVI